MLRFYSTLLALGFCASFAAAEDKKDIPKELLPFQGKWEVKEILAKDAPPLDKTPNFTFEGDKITISMPGEDKKETAKIKVAPDKKPGEIDIMPEGKDKVVKGIYKFDKETLSICFEHGDGKDRPKEFKGEGAVVVLVLQKAKDKK